MRLVLITIITTLQLFPWMSQHGSALPQVSPPSTDPCDSAPCGKGAECKSMGSIAICVCADDEKGDPFVACVKQDSANTSVSSTNQSDQQGEPSATFSVTGGSLVPLVPASSSDYSSTLTSSSSPSSSSLPVLNTQPIVASFDISSGHQPRFAETFVTTPTTSTSLASSTTTQHAPGMIISSTTTQNPFVRIPQPSSPRPATLSSSSSHHHHNNNNNYYHPPQTQPESHRFPIVSEHDSVGNTYHHKYPPRPISSSNGYSYDGSTSDVFNEKTYAPIADFGTNSYSYSNRGQTGHLSGNHHAYEYDSRPISGSSRYPPLSSTLQQDNYGQHGYHPTTSGFPGLFTESSGSRYSGGLGSSYNSYNSVRNDLMSSSSYGGNDGFSRIADPLGKYDSCRVVNGIVVCADKNNKAGDSGYMAGTATPTNYGYHSSRDRDEFSSYYPIPSSSSRYPSSSSSSVRPLDYNYVNRNGYPHHHGIREPIDRIDTVPTYYPFPKEQRISTQPIIAISSSSTSLSTGGTTTLKSRNDNDHHLCKAMCGINSVCRLVLDRPVCGCPEGHTGDAAVRCEAIYDSTSSGSSTAGYCQRHVDCKDSDICAKNKCIDPCKEQDKLSSSSVIIGDFLHAEGNGRLSTSICGTNAECLVFGHTPVCKCSQGYFGNPYVACVL